MRVDGLRYQLGAEHLQMMRVPSRFWRVTYEDIQGPKLKAQVGKYLEQLDVMLDKGVGLLVWGDNSVGKTSAAVVVAKEARKRGASVLFSTCEALRVASISKTVFDQQDEELWLDRARQVEFLVLDDLGKEYSGQNAAYTETFLENFLRERSAERRTTFITMNMAPAKGELSSSIGVLTDKYRHSMIEVLKETCIPVRADGPNRREGSTKGLLDGAKVG